ncbi:MAG: hypothetical protein E5X77_19755 [Mesorhizobium sp.]|nr:MAG: hypothetical protein E5X77_19755 [Mesorhizobium sp.]
MIFFADIENFFSYGDISQEEFDNPFPSSFSGRAGSGKLASGCFRLVSACAAAQAGKHNGHKQMLSADQFALEA